MILSTVRICKGKVLRRLREQFSQILEMAHCGEDHKIALNEDAAGIPKNLSEKSPRP